MIIYVDTKSGKVDITKAELEKLLKERYDEGYKDGQKSCGTVTYSCPYGYGSCPYYYKQPYYYPYVWTSSGTTTAEIRASDVTTGATNSSTNFMSNTGNLFKEPDSTTPKEK